MTLRRCSISPSRPEPTRAVRSTGASRTRTLPRLEAAAKALKRARAQAEQMAQSLNAKLGALLYASNEVQASPIRP